MVRFVFYTIRNNNHAVCFIISLEKEKRVKSGSDGEVTSSSQSESSTSLASLKGGGKPDAMSLYCATLQC